MTEQSNIIDLKFGLNQLSGNRALLIELLGKFTAEYRDLSQRLANVQADGDTSEYRQLVHTVKGVSGNLGLNGLHVAAKTLEKSVLEGHDITTEVLGFNRVLEQTFAEIEILASEGSDTKTKAAETLPSEQYALGELSTILNRNEFLAPDKITELLASTAFTDSQKTALSDAISDLDYPEALKLIESFTQ